MLAGKHPRGSVFYFAISSFCAVAPGKSVVYFDFKFASFQTHNLYDLLIFEIFKYKRAPMFYYGFFGKEDYTNNVFWTFLGSFLLIAYIYLVALLNCRVCKSELDIMKIFLE